MAAKKANGAKASAVIDPGKLSKAELERYPVLNLKVYEIEPLLEDPRNARTHGDENLQAIEHSLRQFGQRKNVVIDKDGVVKAGNGTLRAAKSLGWKYIIGGPAPVDLAKARAFALADNRSAELAGWNDDILKGEFQLLSSDGVDLSLLGWDPVEVQVLLEGPGEGAVPAQTTKSPSLALDFTDAKIRDAVKKAIAAQSSKGALSGDVLAKMLKVKKAKP